MRSQKTFLSIFLMLVVLLAGCKSEATEESEPDAVLTQAMQTAMARLTQTPTTQPSVTNTFQPIPTMSVSPTVLVSPTVTRGATQAPPAAVSTCDNAAFVADITIPDGTEMAAKTAFKKTWELRNAGTCTWNSSYQVVFYSGAQMSAPAAQTLTSGTVAPGQTVQITIDMVAPQEVGRHVGYWLLRNGEGKTFGIGGAASTFYVDIRVVSGSGAVASATNTGSPVPASATSTTRPAVSNTPAPTNTEAPKPTDTTAPYPNP